MKVKVKVKEAEKEVKKGTSYDDMLNCSFGEYASLWKADDSIFILIPDSKGEAQNTLIFVGNGEIAEARDYCWEDILFYPFDGKLTIKLEGHIL